MKTLLISLQIVPNKLISPYLAFIDVNVSNQLGKKLAGGVDKILAPNTITQ